MTFARAIGYFNPESTFDPQENSQELVWEWRTLWADQTWTFDVVVQIGEHIPPATDLLNQIKAWADIPPDIKVNPANNYFDYLLSTILDRLRLPLALKTP
jgi:hypothetical protein